MGKTRDLFKKIRDTKGTFHANMGSIKDRYGMDLKEAEDIKKRWQEYTEELYEKDLHDQDNHNGVITQNQTSSNVKSSGPQKASLQTKLVEVIALISHASKVMLKILQARLQQFVNRELPDVQAGFRKDRGTRVQIANIRWIIKKQESSRKTSISALLTMPKPLTVWITINCGKF